MVSDDVLLLAWRAGEQSAGELLFTRHFAGIARFFRNKVSGDIEELIQRTFLGCLEGQHRFTGAGSFRGYLFGIARNVLFNFYRDQRGAATTTGWAEFEGPSLHDLAPTPSSFVVRHEEQQLLLAALRRLPLAYQIVLELSFWEDMTHTEMAEVLEIPVGTVSTRVRRAKQLLEAQFTTIAASPELRASLSAGFDTWARSLREQLETP